MHAAVTGRSWKSTASSIYPPSLDRMAADLLADPDPAVVAEWLSQSRSLRGGIERVDDALRTAADSAKLNPRALVAGESVAVTDMTASLRGGLETLESELAAQLAETRQLQDSLAELLKPRAEASPVVADTEWPLRGEILAHVDRLRTGLTANSIPRQRRQPRRRTRLDARRRAARRRRAVPPRDRDRPSRPSF